MSGPVAAARRAAWEEQRERGARAMLRAMLWVALHLGRPVARFFLYPTVLYFWLTARPAQRASRDYLRRVLPRAPRLTDVLRHFLSFASIALDRMFILSRRVSALAVAEDRPADVARVADSGNGCLLFISHLGSFESMRLTGTEWLNLPLKILMDREHGRKLTALLDALNVRFAAPVIDTSQSGPELALEVKEALEQGHMICIMADRYRGAERTVAVDFLGGRAPLPAAPWLLAHALRAPVIIGFGLYEGGNRYHNYFELFAERVEIPRERRDEALQAYAQRYAGRLEHYARRHPYNWFNFYDFWSKPDPAAGH